MKLSGKKLKNVLIGGTVLYILYHIISTIFFAMREGFAASAGSPCDKPEDCDSQKCDEKEGIKMCGENPMPMSPGA
jgi:hypothetical protein